MKQIKITLIIVLAIVLLGMLGFVAWAIGGGFYPQAGRGGRLEERITEVDAAQIGEIVADYKNSSIDISIVVTDGNIIRIKETVDPKRGFATISDGKDTGRLKIQSAPLKFRIFQFNFWGDVSENVEILVPASFVGRLSAKTASGNIDAEGLALNEELELSSVSGDIFVREMMATVTDLSTTSGNITVRDMVSGENDLSTVSGEIRTDNMTGNMEMDSVSGDMQTTGGSGTVNAHSTSGNIRVEGFQGKYDFSTVSGTVYAEGSDGYGRASSTSGDITIELAKVSGEISMDSTSGEVTLRIPVETGCTLEAATTSGDITTFLKDMEYNKRGNQAQGSNPGEGNTSIRIDTTSGDIRVEERGNEK